MGRKGNLIAGTDGSGLVYRISPQGKGYVLFEAPRREITSVAVAANGTIYAASVGDKSRNPLPPLTVQGPGMGTMIPLMQPGSMQAANTSASIPEGSEIYALAEGQAPRKLWSSKDEIVYALAAQPEGLLVLTGNRGRVFRIKDDGSFADIAHLEAQQGLSLAAAPSQKGQPESILIGAGNTGKLFKLVTTTDKHEYASDVLDAGALARFGRVEIQPGSANYELLTRTGNVEQPARGRNGEAALTGAGPIGSRSTMARWLRPPAASCNGRPCFARMESWAAWASTTCPSTPLRWWTIWWSFPERAGTRQKQPAGQPPRSTLSFPFQIRSTSSQTPE